MTGLAEGDALVTKTPKHIIGCLSADCGPVLFSAQDGRGAPVIGAVGGRESSEFKRQLAMQAAAWPASWKATVDMPDDDHLSLCDAFAEPTTALFKTSLKLLLDRQ